LHAVDRRTVANFVDLRRFLERGQTTWLTDCGHLLHKTVHRRCIYRSHIYIGDIVSIKTDLRSSQWSELAFLPAVTSGRTLERTSRHCLHLIRHSYTGFSEIICGTHPASNGIRFAAGIQSRVRRTAVRFELEPFDLSSRSGHAHGAGRHIRGVRKIRLATVAHGRH